MQEICRKAPEPELAEQMARKILNGDSSIRALLVIDGGGRILAHATRERFDDEELIAEDDFPMLMEVPNDHASVFLRLGVSARPESIKTKILEIFGERQEAIVNSP